MITPQQLRDTADAMEAHQRGEPIQYAYVSDPSSWMDVTTESYWYLESRIYRPKPKPKTRPWSKPEDVPGPVCWLSFDFGQPKFVESLVVSVETTGCLICIGGVIHRKQWGDIAAMSYSTDRLTWNQCEILE